MKQLKNLIVLFFITLQSLLWSQVQFEAKVSKNTLGLNEKLRVEFTMNADGDNFIPPNFEASGFKIYAGPNQSVSQSWINGKSSFNKTYTYYLSPLQKGETTIRQASIEINNQVYKTSPIKVTVTSAVELPKDPNDTSITAEEAIHLVAEVNKSTPYVNEPITVIYKLYFSYNIGISNFRELNKPKYNDFWSQNIEIGQLVPEEGTYKGERYRYVVLKKTVLYPQKSGNLEIEPLTMDIDVELPTNRRNIFGQVYMKRDNKRVSAGSRTIHVKALPEAGKPIDFSGAVGKFDFKVTPSRTNVKHGESIELNASVSGAGNLKLFTLPKPVVPSSLEMYDPVHKENVSTNLNGMNGKISDNYTIIPQFKGNYIIKPMSFSYFDYAAAKYKTITSEEIVINVMDGPGLATAQAPTSQDNIQKQTINGSDQFKFIHLSTALHPFEQKDFWGSSLFYILFFAPLLCIPLLILFKKKKEAIDSDVEGNKVKKSNRLAKKYLSEAKQHLGNKEPFYIALEKALHNFLKAKLKMETSEMSKEKIQDLLSQRQAQPETITDFIQLVQNCELARYAPSTAVAIQQDYEKAVKIISDLEKQLK
jgi:hypothetical protein